MIASRLQQRLQELLGERCAFDASMAALTTWRVGGAADCLVRPQTTEEIAEIIRLCAKENQPVRVVGAGSNLLILDGGLRGVTILLRQGFDRFQPEFHGSDEVRLTVGAALPMETALDRCANAGIAGLEFAAGIPGSIGGGVRMNAGTKAGEFAAVLTEIEIIDPDGKVRRLPREKLVYRYRGLVLNGPYVVSEAVFGLFRGDPAELRATIDETVARRRERYPYEWPSAGSTFKNPEGDFAGRLIEAAGLKGYAIGDAQISEKHANFIINRGAAKAAEILALIEHVRQTVYQQNGIWLDPEVRIWGERDVPE